MHYLKKSTCRDMLTQSIHNIQITCPYTKSMKIQSRHKPPSSPYLYSPYLSPPLATKHQKGRRSSPELEKTGSSCSVRWRTEWRSRRRRRPSSLHRPKRTSTQPELSE